MHWSRLSVVLVLVAGPLLGQERVALSFSPDPPDSIPGLAEWLASFGLIEGAEYSYAAYDLDGDGLDEALVRIRHIHWCSGDLDNCRTLIASRLDGGPWEQLGYPYARSVAVLPSQTNGWYDLAFDDQRYQKPEWQTGAYTPTD